MKKHGWTLAALAIGGGALALGAVGCGGAGPTPQLRDARAAMQEARSSSAARLKPDELLVAERALARAEAAPDGSRLEADLAYVAERRSQIAMAEARRTELERAAERQQEQYRRGLEDLARSRAARLEETQRTLMLQQQALMQHQRELERRRREVAARDQQIAERDREVSELDRQIAQTREELARQETAIRMTREQLDQRDVALEQTREQLDQERAAREEAEQRAEDAMQRLRELAAVRQQGEETIVTLSGEVLFVTDGDTLRDTARQRLLPLADALRSRPDTMAIVEGHTDSRGSDEYNQRLSQRRAEAVRDFLIAEGVPAARLSAVGRGESSPIAANGTAEGRANNRRVEVHLRPIVVSPGAQPMQPQMEQPQMEQPQPIQQQQPEMPQQQTQQPPR